MPIFTSAKKVVFTCRAYLSVCLSLNRFTKTITDQIFMKFYGIIGHNRGPIDYILNDLESRSLEIKEVKIVFANNSVQNCHRESRQKLKCSSFNSLNISKYDYGHKTDRLSMSIEVKGHSEITP